MSRSASPLRYPGGKACLYDLACQILDVNSLYQRNYVEPYSGGCGLALSLLFEGHVSHVHLNDVDRSVWAFWTAATEHTDSLVSLIHNLDVTTAEWKRQREIQMHKSSAGVLELGFSTFFLNRTNRSGIIHSGGAIGGNSQSGKWLINCRYNKEDLVRRIRRVSSYKNRITFYNEDAEFFFNKIGISIPSNSVIYIDPPYYEKGSQLYKNSYRPSDHERLSRKISTLSNPWFMTYDNVDPIKNLYQKYQSAELEIGYSVQTKRLGSELLVVSDNVRLPNTAGFSKQIV